MPKPLIRFSCECGKRLATPAQFAGRSTNCPKCGGPLTVPQPQVRTASAPPARPQARAKCGHAKLDHFYEVLAKHFEEQLNHHEADAESVSLRFLLPEDRRQVIKLLVDRDEQDREWLIIRSEIGTVSTFEETVTALELNRSLRTGVLYLDEWRVLQIEHRTRLDAAEDAQVVNAVHDVARWADEFEAKLFLIDVR